MSNTAACDRFFTIQELLGHLTGLLDPRDVAHLARTSRKMNEKCTPTLYRNVNVVFLGSGRKNLFEFIPSLPALARNVRHVRSLFFRIPELAYYYNCVLTLEEMNAQSSRESRTLADATTTTTSSIAAVPARQAWLPPPDIRTCQFIAMPLPLNLTIYSALAETTFSVPSANDPRATVAQVCWMISLNPGLTHLDLHDVTIKDLHDQWLLGNALYGLDKLRRLQLWLAVEEGHRLQVGPQLLFKCQSSVQSVTLYFDEFSRQDALPAAPVSSDQGGDVVTAVPPRQEPLSNLEELAVRASKDWATTPSIHSIIANCRNLKRLEIPYIPRPRLSDAVGQTIGQSCTRIEFLAYDARELEEYDSVPFRILDTLPARQVTYFEYKGLLVNVNHPAPNFALLQHSTTLRSIHICNETPLFRISIGTILKECTNLDTLDIPGSNRTEAGHYVTLNDAIEHPWGCTRLTSLALAISGCELLEEPERPPYYFRQSSIILSESETQHFALLEKLYRQIGKLTELELLDLRMIWLDVNDISLPPESDARSWFPVMLSVGSAWTARPGYLHLLSGLSKLGNLYGSFRADSEEAQSTADFPEVVWMDKHWPNLQFADFFASEEDVTAPFRWLRDRRSQEARVALMLGEFDEY